MNTKFLRSAALVTLVSAVVAGCNSEENENKAVEKVETEKCYGIAKAGKNDCAGGENSCVFINC